MYPRHYFFEQVCGVCAAAKRPVPVFSDKHLSWNWEQSKWMYDRAVQLKIPFMAGSSVPLSYRNPWIEYELDTPLEEALTMAYGDLDSYGFHALELLQCMVERRSGGESGIVAVQCLEGDVVWSAADRGLWSRELARAAEEHIEPRAPGAMEDNCRNPALLALEYADGLRASTLMLNGHLRGWGYAGRVSGEIRGMETYLSDNPHPHFSYLGLNIQEFFLHGRPPYPIERTLLVSGALEALAQSRYRGHIRVETPHLNIRYRSYETRPVRPTDPRPVGAATIPW